MNRWKVEGSSNIAEVGHEGDTLEVMFHGGRTYQFKGVSAEVFEQMRAADSAGRFFAQNIKGQFDGRRIDEQE